MPNESISLSTLLEKISQMATDEEFSSVATARDKFLERATEEEKQTVKDALGKQLGELLIELQRQSDESLAILKEHGFEPNFKDYSDWTTNRRYSQEYGVSIEQIDEWIKEGIIPEDCVEHFPELKHNVKLIKDQPYQ